MITTQAPVSIPSSISLAPRPGPKPKPLAEYRSLHALQLVRRDPIATTTTDGPLAQFKTKLSTEIDSDSDNPDTYRRSFTREQKLVAVGYTMTKRVYQKGELEMVLISYKQVYRDLGIQPIQLRKWQKDIDKMHSLYKGSRKGKLSHPAQYPVLEDRLHALILEKRQISRNVSEK